MPSGSPMHIPSDRTMHSLMYRTNSPLSQPLTLTLYWEVWMLPSSKQKMGSWASRRTIRSRLQEGTRRLSVSCRRAWRIMKARRGWTAWWNHGFCSSYRSSLEWKSILIVQPFNFCSLCNSCPNWLYSPGQFKNSPNSVPISLSCILYEKPHLITLARTARDTCSETVDGSIKISQIRELNNNTIIYNLS